MEKFKRKLVELGPVWDFNYINDVTSNRNLFKDPSHFVPDIGRLIVQTIAGGQSHKGDFGVRLTKESIDEQLEIQKTRYQDFKDENWQMHRLIERGRRVNDKQEFNREAVRLIGR